MFTSADKNECATSETNQCDSNALCTNTEGSYVCRCINGYQGDGLQCQGTFRKGFGRSERVIFLVSENQRKLIYVAKRQGWEDSNDPITKKL